MQIYGQKKLMENRKVLILGASSDIGIATVKYFLKKEWYVIAHYNQNSKYLKKIKNKKLKTFKFNLNNISEFKKFLNNNKMIYQVNSFVSLTGYIRPKNVLKIDLKFFYNHININYLSNLIVIQKILPFMAKKKFGRILLSSSTGVKYGGGSLTGIYSLTKYMNEFFFNNYKDFYKKNILINSMRIGLTNTKIHKLVKGKNLIKRINLIPIGRMARTEEVANYIYFFSSELNALTTNEIIDISGGEK